MNTSKKLGALLLWLAVAGAAFAGAMVSGGLGLLDSPPPSVRNGDLLNEFVVFQERGGVTLDASVPLDITEAGTVSPTAPDVYPQGALSPGEIDAGTEVDSWYVHFDTPGNGSMVSGSVTFEEEILGLIVREQSHTDSDG